MQEEDDAAPSPVEAAGSDAGAAPSPGIGTTAPHAGATTSAPSATSTTVAPAPKHASKADDISQVPTPQQKEHRNMSGEVVANGSHPAVAKAAPVAPKEMKVPQALPKPDPGAACQGFLYSTN